jgi:hypothetical protein
LKSQITVTTDEKRKLGSHLVENFIHDVFLIINLAAPGSCDFHGASLAEEKFSEISLSNHHFEMDFNIFFDKRWRVIRVIELDRVIRWYDAVRDGVSQLPQNHMERVLFALLHLAKNSTSPMSVIWLFYAFESLFQTRVGENFSSIVRRASLLLEADKRESELLRKGLRSLYEVRSGIVHGGFEVIHPLHNDILDKRVNDSFYDLITAIDFGHAVLTACVQRIIEKNWCFVQFDERVSGQPIT